MARGVIGALCLVAGIVIAGDYSLWGLIFVVAGLFAIIEAVTRWCVVRACGLQNKILTKFRFTIFDLRTACEIGKNSQIVTRKS